MEDNIKNIISPEKGLVQVNNLKVGRYNDQYLELNVSVFLLESYSIQKNSMDVLAHEAAKLLHLGKHHNNNQGGNLELSY